MTKGQKDKKGKKSKRQKHKKTMTKRQKTDAKKRLLYCDVRAVSHSCDVFYSSIDPVGHNI